MSPEVVVTIAVAAMGMACSWAVWVTAAVFKYATEIALIKQQMALMAEVKEVLDGILKQLESDTRRNN